MEFTYSRTIKVIGLLLVMAALTQAAYTYLYNQAPEVDRKFLWAIEALLFTFMAAFAGSALGLSKKYTLVFSAIAFSAVLNVVQVGIGYVQFSPFRDAKAANVEFTPLASSVVALSFFLYNGAKVLLGLAAFSLGLSKMSDGAKALGAVTALVGVVAMITNALVMTLGLGGAVPSYYAGGSGVAAALLLGVCLLTLKGET